MSDKPLHLEASMDKEVSVPAVSSQLDLGVVLIVSVLAPSVCFWAGSASLLEALVIPNRGGIVGTLAPGSLKLQDLPEDMHFSQMLLCHRLFLILPCLLSS